MSSKFYLVVLLGLAVSVAACSQEQPTVLPLPTSTAASASATPGSTRSATAVSSSTPEPSPVATATRSPTPTSAPSPAASPSPTSPQIEPTQTSVPELPDAAFPPSVGLEPALTGFERPVYLTYASQTPAWESRLLVVEKRGRIMMAEDGQLRPVPFLDIEDRVGSGGSEQGLLSVAFPPDFDQSKVFYVNYTDRRGDTVVARYRLAEMESVQGDPTSEEIILEIAQPAGNHNGGQLQFGPDGYLYIGTGDGGRAGDPWGNAQNPGVLLGKMLRVDVTESDTYRIPPDNPFLGASNARSEIWALGLRNPWRFSFDRSTGDLYIADVGQNMYEEVNYQPADSKGGENYGWDVLEGNHCFDAQSGCDETGLIPPVAEYDHGLGCSITGGYVYRGGRYPEMAGVYFFGDYCSGRMWGLRRTSSGDWELASLLETGFAISSFGQDAAGELYVLDYGGGAIYQLTALP